MVERPETPRRFHRPLLSLTAVLLVVLAATHLIYLAGALSAPGPNTTGEAGKVYFAYRFAADGTLFDSGMAPPYYPSVHGAFLHALPGMIGDWIGADRIELLYIGRAISVGFTVGTLLLGVFVLRALGLQAGWLALIALLLFASLGLTIHTTSYRPDNWLLFYSTAACLIVVGGKRGFLYLATLSVLPSLAFFTKATGLSLLLSIVLGLAVARRYRDAFCVGLQAALLIVLVGTVLQLTSGGEFLTSLRTISGMSFSAAHTVRFFIDPFMCVLGAPLLVVIDRISVREKPTGPLASVAAFWAVSLVTALFSASRTGSNTYYFLEPYFYAALLMVFWLARAHHSFALWPARRVAVTTMLLIAINVSLSIIVFDRLWHGRGGDGALVETQLYGDERRAWADAANLSGAAMFSSDPGLNVLLDRPAVIHPYVQSGLIASGRLPQETMLGPVVRQEYDWIVLSRFKFSHQGVPRLPPEFLLVVERHYTRVPYVGQYLVYEPSSYAEARERLSVPGASSEDPLRHIPRR